MAHPRRNESHQTHLLAHSAMDNQIIRILEGIMYVINIHAPVKLGKIVPKMLWM